MNPGHTLASAALVTVVFAGQIFAAEPVAPIVLESSTIATVWSGHPVGFALFTDAKTSMQYVAYYDADRNMTVASRRLPGGTWKKIILPTKVEWDSHNYIAMAVDNQGQLHVSGNMHAVPLVYFRTATPGDISTLHRLDHLVGDREDSMTYPRFLHTPQGKLVYAYRDGRSGNGSDIYDLYDAGAHTWSRLLDKPLLEGDGKMNAYSVGPVVGPDDFYHLVWVWRDTPDCSSNHDVSYARSKDMIHWETAAGKPLEIPFTLGSADTVDPVPPKGGTINNNTRIGFDADRRVIISYIKYDSAGNTQLYVARPDKEGWQTQQVSNWNYRWDFAGGGTIVFEVHIDAARVLSDGRLVITYQHMKLGNGGFVLDPVTLKSTGPYLPPPTIPEELTHVRSTFPNMIVKHADDCGTWSDHSARYFLRWETLPENRDRPVAGPLPPATELQLYKISE
jgi:hypothetical protein